MQMLLYIVQNHLRSLKDFQSREILIEIGHEKSPIEGWKNQNGAPTFSQNWTILVTNLLWKKTSRCCRHKRKDTKQFVCLLQPILQRMTRIHSMELVIKYQRNFWKTWQQNNFHLKKLDYLDKISIRKFLKTSMVIFVNFFSGFGQGLHGFLPEILKKYQRNLKC